ncbi:MULTISPECIES: hypothetical protein [Micromonospora]|nr:hypothetical protein [Micromonospora maris]
MEQLDEAIECQRRAVDLAEQSSHPAKEEMRAFLVQLEQTKKG